MHESDSLTNSYGRFGCFHARQTESRPKWHPLPDPRQACPGIIDWELRFHPFQNRPTVVTVLNEDRPVASAEEMPPETMAAVESPGAGVLKPLHPFDEIRMRRAEDGMIMIVHQHPRGATLAKTSHPVISQDSEKVSVKSFRSESLKMIGSRQHQAAISGIKKAKRNRVGCAAANCHGPSRDRRHLRIRSLVPVAWPNIIRQREKNQNF